VLAVVGAAAGAWVGGGEGVASCVDEPERRKRAGGREWKRGRERGLAAPAGGRGGWGLGFGGEGSVGFI
jgi:hypothetical protein